MLHVIGTRTNVYCAMELLIKDTLHNTCIEAGFYLEILFLGGNMVDNFKDSKKGHNTPVGAFATSQL